MKGIIVKTVNLDLLSEASSTGGPSALSSVTYLRPAAGPHAVIAPAKYAGVNSAGAYSYQLRFIDGEPQQTVLIDSSQSQHNRFESALALAIEEGDSILTLLPRIRVTYRWNDDVEEVFTDLDLPHRVYDGHIRAGKIKDTEVEVTEYEEYVAARNSTKLNAWALLNISPITLVFGGWDASRRARQGRWASLVDSEIVGVLADQRPDPQKATPRKGGARIDPVGMGFYLEKADFNALVDVQEHELSPTTVKELRKKVAALKDKELPSLSHLGLGGIPPSPKELGAVSCKTVVRSHVLSFAALRQIRFGQGKDGDVAIRAVLAALAINGIVRSDAELHIRAHCHLVEEGPSRTVIDQRHGKEEEVVLPEIEEADVLLQEAIDRAKRVSKLDWQGQILEIQGNPLLIAAATDDHDKE
jgi:CRISPR-associated protein Csb1